MSTKQPYLTMASNLEGSFFFYHIFEPSCEKLAANKQTMKEIKNLAHK